MSKIAVLVYKPTTKTTKKVEKLREKFNLIISTDSHGNNLGNNTGNNTGPGSQLIVRFGEKDKVLQTEVDILILKEDLSNVDEFIQNSKPR